MSRFDKREREEPKEQAGRVFSEEQRQAFEHYCTLLMALADMDMRPGFDGVVAKAFDCGPCGNRAPSGIPRQYAKTKRAICPVCVVGQKAHLVLEKHLNDMAGELSRDEGLDMLRNSFVPPAVREAVKAVLPRPQPRTKATRLMETIARLERELSVVDHPDERQGLERLLASARRAAEETSTEEAA